MSTTTTLDGATTSAALPRMSSMPKLTATQTATWSTPTITPPSAVDNPNVWRTSSPSGLVFIAVGAVAAFIFLSIIFFLIVKKLMARRAAKHTLSLSDSNSSSFGHNGGAGSERQSNDSGEKLLNPFYSTTTRNNAGQRKSSNLPLLYENNLMNNSLADISDIHTKPTENLYSTLDANDNNKRRSMFLSPTAEVMSLQRKQHYHERLVSSLSNTRTMDSKPGSIITDSYTQSSDTDSDHYRGSTIDLASNYSRGENRQKKKTVPSVYLEHMFEESEKF